eukprot:TRINITY_DN19276_c0_g1_i2.p2 TRINITY_DN19276_c0_g1~~TRINITY_DN19276_c0_g1_i2.p2  ORF type:complete len:160 (-),score=37.83 TRINITY_DN19276_c0_g1_i2:37-516(-)
MCIRDRSTGKTSPVHCCRCFAHSLMPPREHWSLKVGNLPHETDDVTKRLSSRKPWGTPGNALSASKHATIDASSGTVECTAWAVRQSQRLNSKLFWKKEHDRVLRLNRLASWGLSPKNHPGTKDNKPRTTLQLSLIHISEPTRLLSISYAVFCLKKKKK